MNNEMKIRIDMTGIWVLAILVFITFLILKLARLVAWSWVWVFSPLWLAVALYIAIFLLLVIIMLVGRWQN
jgi:hypothetical protein